MTGEMHMHDHGSTHSLTFAVGDLVVDPAIEAAGHEPNGYFWEGVARLLAPDLVARLELDSEGDTFCVVGSSADLEALRRVLEPTLTDGPGMTELIRTAESDGFDFAD